MTNANPFAPPKAALVESIGGRCIREGKYVVVDVGGDLPPRCIVCNEPATTPIKSKKLYWHSPWIYLLILVNILVYVIVGLAVRKTVRVSPGLCEFHGARRRRRVFTLAGLGLASLVAASMLLQRQIAGGAAALFVLAFALLVAAAIAGRKVYAREITKEYARLGGCKEPFLASLE